MIDAMVVGRKIAKLRKANNLTQDDLAEKLYITRQALSKWENGISLPNIDILLTLSKIFNASFEDILCLDDVDEIDPNNLFTGHSRMYVINKIVTGKIKVNLPDIFYQFSPMERMLILKAINEQKIKTNLKELYVKLTISEQKYLMNGRLLK